MTETMTLAVAPPQTPVTLVECLLEPVLRSRLSTLGLRRGARLEVVQRTAGGGRIVAVDDSRIALDRSVLEQLRVRPVDEQEAA